MRRAFSLIELILVMVILGIVASVGTDIIRSLYDNYAATAKIQNLEIQANNVADIIANRLEHRIEQTAAVQNGANYAPMTSTASEGSLIFYRRAYELERNFATYKKDSAYAAPRYSGFVSKIETKTEFSADNSFADEITIESIESSGIDLDTYEIFFNDDNSLFYRNKKEPFKRYYSKDVRPFVYGCSSGTAAFSDTGNIKLTRSNCPVSTATEAENIIRPSMARLIHKIYLSNEINRIRLKENELYLDICDAVTDKSCEKKTENLLADNVSTFRFTAISSDENIATGVVFKLCLIAGEDEACQTRIVR